MCHGFSLIFSIDAWKNDFGLKHYRLEYFHKMIEMLQNVTQLSNPEELTVEMGNKWNMTDG